ncbi:hypothetical protein CONLIGDRAFT_640198 [Coniochaeta ligniaria NRRL 30616]|uniref:Uncharacterized protein n=1 Tax=Coniochaeta ligniaria NRRL 30616 TaxID=1408157 RepID=A0A1J7IZY1_9PEZI|nr:hypothetical protein CONLIGDRAFT_640198 [Coniochaeta ligniaria NRRL 30616]
MSSSTSLAPPSMRDSASRQQLRSTPATTATTSARPARSLAKTTTASSTTTSLTLSTTIRVRPETVKSTKTKKTKVKNTPTTSSKSSQSGDMFKWFTQLLYNYDRTPQNPPAKVDYFKVPYQWLVSATFRGSQSPTSGPPWMLHLGIDLKKQDRKSSQVLDITEADGPKCFARHAHTRGSRSSPDQRSWYCRVYLASRDYWMRKADVFDVISCETLEAVEVYKTTPDSPFPVCSSDDEYWKGEVDMPDSAELVYEMATEESCWAEKTKKGYKRVAETMQNRAVLLSLFGERPAWKTK